MAFSDAPQDAVSRRSFLAGMTTLGLGAAAVALGGSAHASGYPLLNITNGASDGIFPGIPGRNSTEKVLNYALALETLEADIYRQALNVAAGHAPSDPLPSDATTYQLSIPAGMDMFLAGIGFNYLQQFAAVEAAHRDFLHSAISSMGATPIEPNPGGYKVDFGVGDLKSILFVLRNVEETGVRAYLGAAQFIHSTKLIQTAASIYSTEARHAAAVNLVLGEPIGPSRQKADSIAVFDEHGDNNFEHYQTPTQILNTVKPFFA